MATNLTSTNKTAGSDINATDPNELRQDIIKNAGDFDDTTGSSNAYVLSIASEYTTYADGDKFRCIANFSNTGAATLNVNAIGAKSIVHPNGNALKTGDMVSGQYYVFVYDATLDSFLLHKFYPITTFVDGTGSDSGSASGVASGTLDSGTISIDLSPFDTNDKVELRYIVEIRVDADENPGASDAQIDLYDKTAEVSGGYVGVKYSDLNSSNQVVSATSAIEPIGAASDSAMAVNVIAGTANVTGTVQPPSWNGNNIDFDWTLTGTLSTSDLGSINIDIRVFAKRVI